MREVLERISAAYLAGLDGVRDRGTGLANGMPGIVLMHAALDPVLPGRGHADAAQKMLEATIDDVAESAPGASFYGGVAGVAWTIDRLRGPTGEDPNAECDQAILEMLAEAVPWDDEHDVSMGLVGYGTYALGRLHRSGGPALLGHVVRRLQESATRDDDGTYWWTDPAWRGRPRSGAGEARHVDLGLIHGTPGIIAFLAQAQPSVPNARPLLEEAVRWLVAHRGTTDDPAAYTYKLGAGQALVPSRIAWCYGDLGIACALLLAARACTRGDWEAVALDLARRSARRDPERSGVIDAGLCHGSAGVALLFARLHEATGDASLSAARDYWLQRTLDAEAPGCRFAGYPSVDLEGRDDASLLTGTAGVALALASSLGAGRAWEQMLLLGDLR